METDTEHSPYPSPSSPSEPQSRDVIMAMDCRQEAPLTNSTFSRGDSMPCEISGEYEQRVTTLEKTIASLERIIDIQARQIERLDDIAADYIVFRESLSAVSAVRRKL
ncbi:hypothetical protein BG004_005228 [Podila humilis]|nr:hypothetical protein BG004_005228 [Podila humilis]